MKGIVLRAPGGLDRLEMVEMPDPGSPSLGDIRVRLHGSSLNYHDYLVVTGRIRTADGRIPMSDGAGVVEAVGEGVTEFTVGDDVISCFFPEWRDGPPAVGDFSTVPGDGVDGYAREAVVRPATWFTPAPRGLSHAEAATLPTAGLTA
jgi:NADPH:quinone reductase-like Zn-dependent oxidoreductase